MRLTKIECSADRFIGNLKLTMSDGTESLLGKLGCEPNKKFSLPSNIKIAKLRAGFLEILSIPGVFWLAKLELFDSNGGLIWKCGAK